MATVEYILIAHTGQYAKRDRLSTYCIAAIEMPTAQMTNFYDAQAYEGILAVFRYKVSWFCQQAKIRQKKTNHRMIGIFNTASLTINGGDEETWTLDLTIMSRAL